MSCDLQAHKISISNSLRRSVTILAFRLRIHGNLTSPSRIALSQERRISLIAVESRTSMGNAITTEQAISARQAETRQTLSADELRKMEAYWRAANYLSVGQIYLRDNPLLERPLAPADIKPRLLGHW